MRLWPRALSIALASLTMVGCMGPSVTTGGAAQPGEQPRAPKRLVTAIMGELAGVGHATEGPVPGKGEVSLLVHTGLTNPRTDGGRLAVLAEAVPTIENGLWKVFPDGRMETTWKIKSDARWHDGNPVTADDLVFTTRVEQDKEVPIGAHFGYSSVQTVEAADPRTITVKWKRTYLQADAMFSAAAAGGGSFGWPLPKHLLEKVYLEDKAKIVEGAYWTENYVGTGPYRLKELVRGSHLIVEANDQYVLGRPKIDLVEVKFLPDSNTLVSNILAGGIDLTMTRGISLEQSLEIRDQWKGGRVASSSSLPVVIFPKTSGANPPAIQDVRMRRALLQAIDRQQITDTVMAGLTTVAHPVLRMSEQDLREVESSIVRYEHDPRRAAQAIEGLGYTRGPDGGLRDASGQRLGWELQTDVSNDIQPKVMYIVLDQWKALGLNVEPVVTTAQELRQSRAWQATFSAFSVRKNPIDLANTELYFHSSQIPKAENNFVGRNYPAYSSPDLDGMVERFNTTIPRPERMRSAAQIVQHVTDQVVMMGLFYDIEPTVIANRLKNAHGRNPDAHESWNAHEWDLE